MASGVPQLERDFCSHQAEEKPLKAHLCLVRSTALDFCVMKGPVSHAICCRRWEPKHWDCVLHPTDATGSVWGPGFVGTCWLE